MNYQSGFNKKRNTQSITSKAVVVTLVICVIALLYILAPAIISTINPVWFTESNLFGKTNNGDTGLTLRSLLVKSEQYDSIAQLETAPTSTGILSKITRRPPFTMYDKLVIDRGDMHGVVVGNQAYKAEMFVGNVTEVFRDFSIVTMITSPDITTHADINGSEVFLKGQGNGKFVADLPRDINVKVGDTVYSRERELYIIGIVESVEAEGEATLQKIYVSLPETTSSIKWVILK